MMEHTATKKRRKKRRGQKKEIPTPPKSPNLVDGVEEDDTDNPYMSMLPLDGVVKVYANLTDPDYESPWQMCQSNDVSGSGFVISGKRVMTNAHVVANSTFVAVRRFGSAEKVVAKVICIAHDCDLALLKVDDHKFWKNMDPLQFATRVPQLQEKVHVAGYPEGGDTISITRGIVSRIELGPYTSTLDLLTVQIDAAINPGNSGGPVFSGTDVIGVAFSGLDDADGIGYIIPTPVISHFLVEVENNSGKWRGFCSLGIEVQNMENKGLRDAYKLPEDQSGLLIRHIDPISPCFGKVNPEDVLLSVDDTAIANDGTAKWRKRERINFRFLVQQAFPGVSTVLGILRDGVKSTVEVVLRPIPTLIPSTLDAPATYISWAGLVFVPLSYPFMDSIGGENWGEAPPALQRMCHTARRRWADQEVVVLARVLLDDVNLGYEEEEGSVVCKVNGVEVINLGHLYVLITQCKENFLKIQLAEDVVLCFNTKEGHQATGKINEVHKIPSITNLKI